MARAFAVLLAALTVAGCEGSEDKPEAIRTASEAPAAEPRSDEEVIHAWAAALTDGDTEAAAALFALPSVAENGALEIEIQNREDAVAFNESLPCGAELVRAEAENKLTIATFQLTERPGPGECGLGADGTAQTAFEIEDGKIVEWRRVVVDADLEPGQAV